MLSINACRPRWQRGKKSKRKRDSQTGNEYNITNNANKKRNKTKYTKMILSFLSWVPRVLASHHQLPGSTRKLETGLSSTQEVDSGTHGSESGLGSQVEQ